MTPPLSGLILAGGYSRRMGRDKAHIAYHGQPQWRHLIELLQVLGLGDICMAVRAEQAGAFAHPDATLLPDAHPGAGPGMVLRQAWQQAPGQAWLVLACDMPGLTTVALQTLLAGRKASCYATAFVDPLTDWPTPLCAIWEPKAAAAFGTKGASAPGPLAVMRQYPIHTISPQNPAWLLNVNTPAEQARWQQKHRPAMG